MGDYVLQVTPKKVAFKEECQYAKVTTSLALGDNQLRSPYARYVRNNQGAFYGERLKVTGNLKEEGSLTVFGVTRDGAEEVISRIVFDLIPIAEREEKIQVNYEDQKITLEYEIEVYMSDPLEDEYFLEGSETEHGQPFDTGPLLLEILSNGGDDVDLKLELNKNWPDTKEISLPDTPRLCEQVMDTPETVTFNQINSTGYTNTQRDKDHAHAIPSSLENIKTDQKLVSPRTQFSPQKIKSPRGLVCPPSLPKSPKGESPTKQDEPPIGSTSKSTEYAFTLLGYTILSAVSFYCGMYLKSSS